MVVKTICVILGVVSAVAVWFFSAVGNEIILEIMLSEGGYGSDWLREIAKNFESVRPGVKVEIVANPWIEEVLRPRFVAGDPPDLCTPGRLAIGPLIYEGQIMPLDDLLETPPYGATEGRWIDSFIRDLWEPLKYGDHHYIMPLFMNVIAWWYDDALWKAQGWMVPNTWSEFLVLAEEMKNKGLAPITTTGVYPIYPVFGLILPTAVQIGGASVLENAFNLLPGAWQHPAFIEAARIWQQVAAKYFAPGWQGANHIEAHTLLVLGKAAIDPCGSWLPREMAQVTPPGVELRAMLIPGFPDTGKLRALCVDTDNPTNFVIPAKAKHPELAAEFLKFMTSPSQARIIAERTGAMLSIKGIPEELLSPSVASAFVLLDRVDVTFDYRNFLRARYPELAQEIHDATFALLTGSITPETWALRIEKKAEEIRSNPDIRKDVYKIRIKGQP